MLTVIAVCAGWFLVFADRPVISADETPIAFWSWRSTLPSQEVVDRALVETGSRLLFVRAGTFNAGRDGVTRIRSVGGEFPKGITIHAVYNGTPELLEAFEHTDPSTIADTVIAAYAADRARADADEADLRGVQLDLDVPTRLLPQYGALLAMVRARLAGDVQLSVTGLPTWMTSPELEVALAPVDFWIPQFYGGSVPRHVQDATPIAAAEQVRSGVRRARRLGKPFFAGLAAYGYTLQYNAGGSLRALHGAVDPARVARSRDVEFVPDLSQANPERNDRRAYRVLAHSVLDGMTIVPGDVLVVETPSSELLRASVRAAREEGGEALIGICVFRLPESADPSVLSIPSIAVALADRDSGAAAAAIPVRRIAVREVRP